MENQPPTTARPWFRLASLARLEQAQAQASPQPPVPAPVSVPAPAPTLVPAPAPAPIPRIPLARALTMLTQAPQVPPRQQETAPTRTANGEAASLESQQPPQKSLFNGEAASQSESQQPPQKSLFNGEAASESDSQQPAKPYKSTPPPSPRASIPASRPGSPRVINPDSSPTPPQKTRGQLLTPLVPHPEPEPKPLEEEPLPKSIFAQREEDGTNGNAKAAADTESTSRNKTGTRKRDDGETKVITMAGENTGAYMELGQKHLSSAVNHPNGHHRNLRHQSELGSQDGNVDHAERKKEKPVAMVVNSNVQSVNNSILLSSSCTMHSPGVHITTATHPKPKFSKGSKTSSSFRPHFH